MATMKLPQSLLLVALMCRFSFATAGTSKGTLQFGLINGGSAFFDPIKEGFNQRCKELGVTCFDVVGFEPTDCTNRTDIVRDWIAMGVNGIAIKPCLDHDVMAVIFEEARQAGVPTVTFDDDVPDSARTAYVGTDNKFLGRTMAKLLRQLRSEGGTFALVGSKAERDEGFLEEITKFNERDDRTHWFQIFRNFSWPHETDWIYQMETYAELNVTAIITMIQSPMRESNWTSFVETNRHRNITYIGTDGSDYQIDYLNRRLVDGLVGQLPFVIGTKSLQVLYDIVTKGNVSKTIFTTHLVSYNLIPLELPPPDIDEHLIGNLKYVGYVCYGLVVLSSFACMIWTYYRRSDIVIRAAQPCFLAMVAIGVLIMSSSLVPLSFDDRGDPESMSTTRSEAICMSIPWLLFIGFAVTFSALLSKTWRVNRLFHAEIRHARIQVTVKDVLLPFVVLLTGNIVVLICWTISDPLTYLRVEDIGTDSWNREISSYGACCCNISANYLVPLSALNFVAVIIACCQAYQARGIKSEFSEAKYIGLTVFSLFQAFMMGVPVVAVVRDMPEAFYLVLTIMIFLLCMAVLLLIYLPKMFLQHKYAKMTVSEQRRALQACLNRSSVTKSVQEGEASLSVRNFALNSNSERNSVYSVPPKPFLETIASGVEELAIQEENSLSRDSTEAPTKIATEIKLETSYQDQKAMR
jgi:gamma-aminobutyric acid type B receptor